MEVLAAALLVSGKGSGLVSVCGLVTACFELVVVFAGIYFSLFKVVVQLLLVGDKLKELSFILWTGDTWELGDRGDLRVVFWSAVAVSNFLARTCPESARWNLEHDRVRWN